MSSLTQYNLKTRGVDIIDYSVLILDPTTQYYFKDFYQKTIEEKNIENMLGIIEQMGKKSKILTGGATTLSCSTSRHWRDPLECLCHVYDWVPEGRHISDYVSLNDVKISKKINSSMFFSKYRDSLYFHLETFRDLELRVDWDDLENRDEARCNIGRLLPNSKSLEIRKYSETGQRYEYQTYQIKPLNRLRKVETYHASTIIHIDCWKLYPTIESCSSLDPECLLNLLVAT